MISFTMRAYRRSAVLAALITFALATSASAQDNTAPAPAPAPAATAPLLPPQPPPAGKPGFLHQLKVWWDDSRGLFRKPIDATRSTVEDVGKKTGDVTKGAADAAGGAVKGAADVAGAAVKGAVEATKDTATTIVKLPNTRLIDVRERCVKAPNGAPDCETAAANGCRAKGFSGGKPLDVRTAKICDTTAVKAAGQTMSQPDCSVETTVTRAVCQ
jgi:hypothetical protein